MAVKLGLGYPMGPFELLDYTGIDLHKNISDDPSMNRTPSPLIDRMVAEVGWLCHLVHPRVAGQVRREDWRRLLQVQQGNEGLGLFILCLEKNKHDIIN